MNRAKIKTNERKPGLSGKAVKSKPLVDISKKIMNTQNSLGAILSAACLTLLAGLTTCNDGRGQDRPNSEGMRVKFYWYGSNLSEIQRFDAYCFANQGVGAVALPNVSVESIKVLGPVEESEGASRKVRLSVKINITAADTEGAKKFIHAIMLGNAAPPVDDIFLPDLVQERWHWLKQENDVYCNLTDIRTTWRNDFEAARQHWPLTFGAAQVPGNFAVAKASPEELRLQCAIGGEVIAEMSLNGTSIAGRYILSGRATPSQIEDLDEGVCQIAVQYWLQDKRVMSADVRAASGLVVDSAFESFQRCVTQATTTSSGFLFWTDHRSQIKQDAVKNVQNSIDSQKRSQQTVVLTDSTPYLEGLVSSFLAQLLSEDTVNESDLANAHKAAAQDHDEKSNLHAAHTKYADYLSKKDNRVKVDAAKALAALAQEDVLSFLAHGFASSNSRDGKVSVARANLRTREAYDQKADFFATQTQTTQRLISDNVVINDPFGMVERPQRTQWTGMQLSGQTYKVENNDVQLVTSVVRNSPAHKAGIEPGMMVKVDSSDTDVLRVIHTACDNKLRTFWRECRIKPIAGFVLKSDQRNVLGR